MVEHPDARWQEQRGMIDMSSSAHSVRSRLLRGERDLFEQDLLTRGWSRRGGGEKLSMDSNRAGLWGIARLLGRGVVVVLLKATFSLRKATFVIKK